MSERRNQTGNETGVSVEHLHIRQRQVARRHHRLPNFGYQSRPLHRFEERQFERSQIAHRRILVRRLDDRPLDRRIHGSGPPLRQW